MNINKSRALSRQDAIALSFWIVMLSFMLYHLFLYVDRRLLFVIYILAGYGAKYYFSKKMGFYKSFLPSKSTVVSWGVQKIMTGFKTSLKKAKAASAAEAKVEVHDNMLLIKYQHQGKTYHQAVPYQKKDQNEMKDRKVYLVGKDQENIEITQMPGTLYPSPLKMGGKKLIIREVIGDGGIYEMLDDKLVMN